jgi:hypothetical protein
MLDAAVGFGHPEGWQISSRVHPKVDSVRKVVAFLDLSLQDSVSSFLVKGYRIPEEVLGPEELVAAWTPAPS